MLNFASVPAAKVTGASFYECWCLGIETVVTMLACGHLRCLPAGVRMGELAPCGECAIEQITGDKQPKPQKLTAARCEELEAAVNDRV